MITDQEYLCNLRLLLAMLLLSLCVSMVYINGLLIAVD